MTEQQQKRKSNKNRGNLHDYFDPNVHDSIYGKRPSRRAVTAPTEVVDLKRTALVRGPGGRFEIDRKVLVEECAADLKDAWFYKDATRAITHRWDSTFTKVFNPRSADMLPKPEVAGDKPAEKKDLLSELNLQIVEDERNTKLHNSKYKGEGEVRDMLVDEASRKPEDRELDELFHNAAANNGIDTFVKRKYVSMRTNLNLGVNSPDIILFKECLKRNVLPPGSLDIQKSSDLDLNNSFDPSVSTRQLALMTSTVLGRTTVGTGSIAEADMNNSYLSLPESVHLQLPHSGQSIGSIDSTDVIGIENEQVISINLNNRSIGNDRGICLSAALSYCPHLTVIRLSNNRLTDRSLSMILKAVFNISYCEELDISCNSVGDLSTACLEEYLKVSHCALRKLNVRRCAIDDDNCIRLCRSLHSNEALEALDLSENLSLHDEFTLAHGDTPSGGAAMAELIMLNTTLQELRAAGNHLRKQCVQLIAEKLASNPSLRLLDLSRNDIGDHEGRLIGRALHTHRTLTHLDLSFNKISSKGAITIAYAAQQPDCALVYVNLNENVIGKLGGVYMLRAMRAVASYPDNGHHKHARHFAQHQDITLSESVDAPPTRRALSIDYQVTVLPTKDENIYDVHRPLKHYALNLADAYDYTIARMLVDLADRHPFATFKSLKFLQPGSHLWEFIHLGRGGLFELPAEYGQTAMQVWSDHAAQITEAVEAIQAAKIAEMQAHSMGGRDKTGRRKAFRAPSASDTEGVSSNERLGSAISITQSPGGGRSRTSSDAGSGSEAAKHVRHQTRSARHVLYRIGVKIGFSFEEDVLHRIIDKLCSANPESRVKFVTLVEIIYKQVFAVFCEKHASAMNAHDSAMHIPMNLLAEQMSLFGCYKDTDMGVLIPAMERARRLISECDLAEDKTRLSFKWYMQLMMSRQIDALPLTSRTYWAALNTTHPWAVPIAGLLHVELTYPPLPPTVHHVLSNVSFLSFLSQATNSKDTQRAFDQIEQVLLGTNNELFLTCIQAEAILQRLSKFKAHSHFSLVESLTYQMVSPMETRRFVVRNLYFNETLTLRRKQNYMFKVLTGMTTGHYVLDLRSEQHRAVAMRLAELNNFNQMQNLKRDINTSQCGTGDCFRNASLNSAYVLLDSAWFTELPEVGKLRFDYVSPLRCPDSVPPSSGTWGCSFEGYGGLGVASGDDYSAQGSVYGENEEGVYDETAEHRAKFSTLHGKEQFAQELVENLFAKKFEPRSKAKRKETRSCPKNTIVPVKRGGPKSSGKFIAGMNTFVSAKEATDGVKTHRQSYVTKMKKIGFESSVQDDSTQQSKDNLHVDTHVSDSSSESSGDEFGLRKATTEAAAIADSASTSTDMQGASSPSPHRDDSFSQWNMRSKMFQKPPTPVAAAIAAVQQTTPAASPTKMKAKREKPLSRVKEVYLGEVTEYWKDTADTCWARCRATHVEVLKKKLDEIVQDEMKGKASEKDINAGIPPSAYMHKDFVMLRNTAIYKSVGQYVAKGRTRRPVAALGGLSLNYSLNQTAMWGGLSGSKKYPVALEKATVDEIANAENTVSGSSSKFPSASFAGAASTKVRRASTAMSAKMKGEKTLEALNAAMTTVGGSLTVDDSGAAAVISKLAFEKFLLRLEAVVLYNVWLTVDQVYIILQALLAHSAPVSVIVRSLCVLYNCIVDRAPFYSLLQCGSDQLRCEVVHRLGILNVWSPQHPDGKFDLDLAALDNRQAFRFMCALVHETTNKPGRHEMIDVVYYKDSLLDAPAHLTVKSATRATTQPGGNSNNNRAGNTSPVAGTNDSFSFTSEHMPSAWTPPDLWSKADPAGPPNHGHIQFAMRTISAPAYSII